MDNKFSVLLSVYKNDAPDFFDLAIKSIWDDQLLKPSEIVLVKDGPLTGELDVRIDNLKNSIGINFKVLSLEKNVGLAAALNAGLAYCEYALVARMDVDDIALPQRFSTQIPYMVQNPDVAVSSAWIEEYDHLMEKSAGIRKVPVDIDDVIKFSKRRNPISHPVSVFRKEAVLAVGGYPLFRKAQDYALWSLLLKKGYKITNLPEVLLHMRTGDGLMSRRGINYLKHEIAIMRFQRDIGFINTANYYTNLTIRVFFRIQPNSIKKVFYKLLKK